MLATLDLVPGTLATLNRTATAPAAVLSVAGE
jgi:hypothetical protein